MKQIIQNIKNGKIKLIDIPRPNVSKGSILIKTKKTLISSGTEKMLTQFGKANWLDKAKMQPNKVKEVISKIKTDGLIPSFEAVLNKLNEPLPLGYCNVGEVIEIGENVSGFQIGDRILSNGKHSEVVCVPKNLCAKIPDNVSYDEAVFTILASVALQGIRLSKPTLGERIVVIGLGLVGLITVQLLKANGCKVLGVDNDDEKLRIAEKFGAEVINFDTNQSTVSTANSFSNNNGADAVIITASTNSNQVIHEAAQMSRKRGRIILVGVTGLNLNRDDFYEKELKFQVSSSYGPGRYEKKYEDKGYDYPIGFIRWTENRNFEAILEMMAEGKLNLKSLISNQFDIEDYDDAYNLILSNESSLGVVFNYPSLNEEKYPKTIVLNQELDTNSDISLGATSFIGSGNYASKILIPNFKKAGAKFYGIASNSGLSGTVLAKKYNFSISTTDSSKILNDNHSSNIVIATKHDTHAEFILKALHKEKNIFVEKPLCINLNELSEIEKVYNNLKCKPILMVGFNRRFSPLVAQMKSLLNQVSTPKAFIMTINSGHIPMDDWTQDNEIGGGRIIGEVCHFIDLLRYLSGQEIISCTKQIMNSKSQDTLSIQITFIDGSIGTIHYFSNGSKLYPKERVEVFTDNKVIRLDNYKKLVGFGWKNFSKSSLWKQDKGQYLCVKSFIDAIKEKKLSSIPFNEIIEVTKNTIEVAEK